MTPEEENTLAELIEKRLNESISDSEAVELENTLKSSEQARRLFLDLSAQHADLRMLGDSLTVEELHTSRNARPYSLRAMAAAAAIVFGCFLWMQSSRPSSVATLVTNENTAWESSLPTTAGSELAPGLLELKEGVATIKFHSGAEVILEAPAKLELRTAMHGKLFFGAAVIDVPEPAIGFIMETPGGYAVDHGTQFAVKVSPDEAEAAFMVISGEISVHDPSTGKELRMTEDQVSILTDEGLNLQTGAEPRKRSNRNRNSKRIRSAGRATSIIRNDDQEHLQPDLLLAKSEDVKKGFDRRSLFAFNVNAEDVQRAKYARIRLYAVPSGMGYAAYVPQQNVFAVYAVTNELAEDFPLDCKWDQAPPLSNTTKLGTFELPRSKQKGVVWFRNDAILDFVKQDTTGVVTFILVRETSETHRHGLVHAFANDSHPDGTGPVLDLGFEEFQPAQYAKASK